ALAAPAFSSRDLAIYISIAAVVMMAVTGLLWPISRKLFLFHVAPLKITGRRQVAESLRQGRNVVVLLPIVSECNLDVPRKSVDLSLLNPMTAWNEAMPDILSTPPNLLVELLHFEYLAPSTEVANQKFVLLELLLKRPNTQVAVIMTVPVSSEDYRRTFP